MIFSPMKKGERPRRTLKEEVKGGLMVNNIVESVFSNSDSM